MKKLTPALVAIITVTVAAVVLTRSASSAETRPASERYKSILLRGVPHVKQKPDFCGEACAAMALRHFGHAYDQDAVFDHAGLSPLKARGCYTKELTQALKNIGFDPGPVWHRVSAKKAEAGLQQLFKSLHADLADGVPSIVCTRYDERPNTTEHFRLVLGYDARTDEVIYHEPAAANGAYRRMPRKQMLELWPLKYDTKTWTVIRMRLAPKKIPRPTRTAGFTDADYAQHVMRLKEKLPSNDFHIVLEKPFVVVGDEAPQTVERRAAGTIRWSIQKLKKDYFSKDPDQIIDIWLFKDKDSYRKHTKAIFNDTPSTPFGYYSSTHRALVMNISTGGGTLVHEIVHPFIASNFPDCPSWFNEGLASLYEQCGEKNGKIYGHTNWRLSGLQRAVRARGVPSFETLCGTTTREFYDDPGGTNYGQARYLCYYLQEQGKLREFYHQFHKDAAKDPTGLTTLRAVLKQDDLAAFKKAWEAYVLKLRF